MFSKQRKVAETSLKAAILLRAQVLRRRRAGCGL